MTKRSGFWGQGEGVLPDLPATGGDSSSGSSSSGASVAPLGQLEFVLDRRRRRGGSG